MGCDWRELGDTAADEDVMHLRNTLWCSFLEDIHRRLIGWLQPRRSLPHLLPPTEGATAEWVQAALPRGLMKKCIRHEAMIYVLHSVIRVDISMNIPLSYISKDSKIHTETVHIYIQSSFTAHDVYWYFFHGPIILPPIKSKASYAPTENYFTSLSSLFLELCPPFSFGFFLSISLPLLVFYLFVSLSFRVYVFSRVFLSPPLYLSPMWYIILDLFV